MGFDRLYFDPSVVVYMAGNPPSDQDKDCLKNRAFPNILDGNAHMIPIDIRWQGGTKKNMFQVFDCNHEIWVAVSGDQRRAVIVDLVPDV